MGTIKYKNEIDSIYGLTGDEILEALQIAWKFWESVADLDIYEVDSGQQVTLKSDVLYAGYRDGKHFHARGRRRGNTLYLHNGFIPAHFSNNGEEFLWKPFNSSQPAGQVMAHELGHWLGLGHNTSDSCIMSSNAIAKNLCESEKQFIINRYGELKPNEPINPPSGDFLPRGTIIDNVNLPDIQNGSYVINGERKFLKGQKLVGTSFQVWIHEEKEQDCCITAPN